MWEPLPLLYSSVGKVVHFALAIDTNGLYNGFQMLRLGKGPLPT